MTFSTFCVCLNQLEQASGRNAMIDILAGLIKDLHTDELEEAMYLLQGRIAPLFMPVEFQLSGKSLIKALHTIDDSVETQAKETGDIGLAAEAVAGSRQGAGLKILDVFRKLQEIAAISGANSQAGKQAAFLSLFAQLSGLEARYVCRIIIGKLRLGVSEKSVLDALSIVLTGDKSCGRRSSTHSGYGLTSVLLHPCC
ncbi:MAG: DNA ligase [candidate division WS6 bacterium OLB20]|uniref:DNA ligase n=1 Tax=candidate division WS6 bacterium OLB20 TaxID=1617426 RepID=A0A136LYM5_9BACT|nr:MAG: DNA ligase [candidate division WS6 bacterium OLB20]